ncbi:hypothetical protein BD626DRAFT_460399 [Schizophyllum amplum]|uniref:Carbonyl reductase n=1 Tax=Schizophyllum amplum TaxID=97359 RepID=A0A550C8M1_9AGAR|nr:hypothetical protein BD626DRAFT_460399 [Auriculariopsis ampla]
MSSYARVAVVTGANKGIGFAIVRNLALQYPSSALNSGPLCLYLTARDASRGQAALNALNADAQLRKAKALQTDGGPVHLKYHTLDVSDTKSIDTLVDDLKREHGQIDVLVNNAGIALDGFDAHIVTTTLKTNYHGTLYATLQFLTILRSASTSRVVNVASTMGLLNRYTPQLRQRFRDAAEGVSLDATHTADTKHAADAATALMREFEDAVKAGTHTQLGFPSSAYAVSKAGLIAATRAVARSVVAKANAVEAPESPLVNSCCPGWVNTDMSKGKGSKTIDEGARTPVMLALETSEKLAALGRSEGVCGGFWRDEKLHEW